jgi:hypothetical protein
MSLQDLILEVMKQLNGNTTGSMNANISDTVDLFIDSLNSDSLQDKCERLLDAELGDVGLTSLNAKLQYWLIQRVEYTQGDSLEDLLYRYLLNLYNVNQNALAHYINFTNDVWHDVINDYDADLVESNCVSATTASTLTFATELASADSITNSGTATVTLSTTGITVTADGTLFEVYVNGILFPFAEGNGTVAYGESNSIAMTGINWTTQDAYHYNLLNGFDMYADTSGDIMRVPIGSTVSQAGWAKIDTFVAGANYIPAETKFKLPAEADLIAADDGQFFTGGTPKELSYEEIINATAQQEVIGTASTVGADGQGQALVEGRTVDGVSVVNPVLSSCPPFVAEAPIYGVQYDTTVSGDSAVIRTDDAVGLSSEDMLSVYPWSDFSEVTDSYGNTFVRIPKHYMKIWDDGDVRHFQVSEKPFPGSWLPWCFWDFDNEQELDYVDYGKYTASVDGSNRLESKPDKYPAINYTIVQIRTFAENNGPGYQQTDPHTEGILQDLFFIHHKVRNCQSIYQGYVSGQHNDAHDAVVAETSTNRIIIANTYADLYQVGQAISVGTARGSMSVFYGRTITSIDVYDASNKAITFDGGPVDIAIGNNVWNSPYKSGWSTTLENGYAVANDGKSPCAYMGIENPWGNQWKWVDGVNINDNQAWIALDARDYASNVFASPYKKIGYLNATANGYAEKLGLDSKNPWMMFPTNVGSSSFWGDYCYQNPGARVALLGGALNYGSNAGLRYWNMSPSSAGAAWYIGGRLVRKAF